jgi:hypothetical protein
MAQNFIWHRCLIQWPLNCVQEKLLQLTETYGKLWTYACMSRFPCLKVHSHIPCLCRSTAESKLLKVNNAEKEGKDIVIKIGMPDMAAALSMAYPSAV